MLCYSSITLHGPKRKINSPSQNYTFTRRRCFFFFCKSNNKKKKSYHSLKGQTFYIKALSIICCSPNSKSTEIKFKTHLFQCGVDWALRKKDHPPPPQHKWSSPKNVPAFYNLFKLFQHNPYKLHMYILYLTNGYGSHKADFFFFPLFDSIRVKPTMAKHLGRKVNTWTNL